MRTKKSCFNLCNFGELFWLATFVFVFAAGLSSAANAAVPDGGPTIAEILAKHAESIGTPESRITSKSRIAIGTSTFNIKMPASTAEGKALFASNAENLMMLASYSLTEYPFEKIGMFRRKVEVPFVRPGARSPIGSYLYLNDDLIKEHIFGGSIFSTWALLNSAAVADRLKSAGKKKVTGREAFVLRYQSRSGASSTAIIEIFFDAKDFRHIRTEYRQTIPQTSFYQIGIFGNQTGESVNILTEDFGDFRLIDGLTLPHKYEIKLLLDGRSGTNEFRWQFTFDTYRIGQNLGAEFFRFDAQ